MCGCTVLVFFVALAFAYLLLREKRLRVSERASATMRVTPADLQLVENDGRVTETAAQLDRGAAGAATTAVAMARARHILLMPIATERCCGEAAGQAEEQDRCWTCSICLGDCADSSDGVPRVRRTECGHVFHDVCLLDLVSASLCNGDQSSGAVLCPNCRSVVF